MALLRPIAVHEGRAVRYRPATDADVEAIQLVLERCGLPTADLQISKPEFTVACESRAIVGVGGLERFGATGLLRSIAVSPERRGLGVGGTIVADLERRAFTGGLTRLVLLTETARDFFESQGYQVIDRERVPEPIRRSMQFRSLCPKSAFCMTRTL